MQGAVIFYFSGTGNTAWVSKKIAICLKEKNIETIAYNIEEICIKDIKKLIKGKKYVGFGYPIYGCDLPKPMKEFLIRFPSITQKIVFCFCTQESFSGYGERAIKKVMWKSKGKIKFSKHFIMPSNIIFKKYCFKLRNDSNINQSIVDNTLNEIETFTQNIVTNTNIKKGYNMSSYLLGFIQKIFYKRFYKRFKKELLIDNFKCIKCGKCKQYCPMNNIVFKENKYKIGEDCCLCSRCYNYCEQGAVLYKKTSIKNINYKSIQNFEHEIKDITRKCYHNGELPKSKDKRFVSIFIDTYGNLQKEFKLLIILLLVFCSIFILTINAPIEIKYIASKLLCFVIFTPIFIYYLLNAFKKKKRIFFQVIFTALIIFFTSKSVVLSVIDVLSEPQFITTQVLNIERSYGKASKCYIDISYYGKVKSFFLWGENKYKLSLNQKYTFRIMKKTNTAIIYYDSVD